MRVGGTYVYIYIYIYIYTYVSVSEIKVLFSAPTGCTSPETVRPEISPYTLFICSYNNYLKNVHTPGAHLRKSCTRP